MIDANSGGGPNDLLVTGGATVTRLSTEATVIADSFSVGIPQNSVLFTGGVQVNDSASKGSTVSYSYHNLNTSANKYLCGTSANPIRGSSWVVATAVTGH